jgi:cell division initiation protein
MADQGSPEDAGTHARSDDEQVTGSLERVSAATASEGSRLSEVREPSFPVALRGYEREAVDAYVERVARLVAELEASRSPDEAVRRALDQVGEETSGILQRAQETASEVTARSRAQADDRLRDAEREATAITADAEERVRELEADFGRIWDERERLLDGVRELAERLLATADDAEERWETQDEDPPAEARLSDDTASLPAVGGASAAGAPDGEASSATGPSGPDAATGAGEDAAGDLAPAAASTPIGALDFEGEDEDAELEETFDGREDIARPPSAAEGSAPRAGEPAHRRA